MSFLLVSGWVGCRYHVALQTNVHPISRIGANDRKVETMTQGKNHTRFSPQLDLAYGDAHISVGSVPREPFGSSKCLLRRTSAWLY